MKTLDASEVTGQRRNDQAAERSLKSVNSLLSESTSIKPTENIRRQIDEGQICVLTFDRPDSSANLFDRATLLELDQHLDFISHSSELRGVVFTSAKASIFIAGADLHELAGPSARVAVDRLLDLVRLGQSVFNRIAALPIPTVAAIHGACLGGGCELSLACDYRVASPDRATKIGLPETQLGILPAWGGCTRLPRLIGLPKALDVILAGKTLAAKPALKLGLLDEITPRERLVESACRKIAAAAPSLTRIKLRRPGRAKRAIKNNAVVATSLAAYLRSRLFKKTRGHYPAIFKALEVMTRGASRSVEESLALERDAIVELTQTEPCRNLVRVFFLQERAKKLNLEQTLSQQASRSAVRNPQSAIRSSLLTLAATEERVCRCAVIGAGVMGAGIAQWLSARGLSVILRDINPEQVGKGMAAIARLYQDGVKRHLFTPVEARSGIDRIFPAATEVPLQNIDLVIEAAVEKMELKQQLFRRLDELAGPGTILATNTSALSVSEIAAATRTPRRVVGIHFFNPVHRMQLVEVIHGEQTDLEVLRRAVRFVQQMGKLPVVVKDSPGFLVNRILMPYLLEAGRLFEAGARAPDIDEAMLEFGMPMGPLRLIDEVGLDVARHVAETLAGRFSERMHVPLVLDKMLKAGLLGRKSQRGFYSYNQKTSSPSAGVAAFQADGWAKNLRRETVQQHLTLLMVNEAARCLEERIVASPQDVDFAMIMGTGFAPFRGGPLRYADSIGARKLIAELNALVESGDAHFQPSALLERLAASGEQFYREEGGLS